MTQPSTDVVAQNRPVLRRGGTAVQEVAESQTNSKFVKTEYFSLEDKESAILRFLTDDPDWWWVDQHQFVDTKPAPDAETAKKWPKAMTAVCRKDKAFAAMYPDGCFICDFTLNQYGKPNKPSVRIWALACRREEVIENGQIVGYRDKIREEPEMKDGEATGNVVKVKDIVVVNMGYKNFFGALHGYFSVFKTILDRDYHITRNGTGTATDYAIIGLNPIPGHDLRDEAVLAKYAHNIDMVDLITSKTTDDYFHKFFDTRVVWTPPKRDGDASGAQQAAAAPQGAPVAQQAKPSSDVSDEALRAMQDRVRGLSPEAQAPQSAGGAPASAGDANPAAPETPAAAPPTEQPAAAGGFRNFD